MKRGLNQLLLIVSVIALPITMRAQSVAINDDGTAPHASAMLDIKVNAASKKGILIPRMTSAQRTAIAAPAAGLMVYDTDTQSFWYWNATAWTNIAGSGGAGPWAQVGSRIYNTNTGNVGIGTTNPRAKLNVAAGRPVLFGLDTAGVGVKAFWLPSKAAFRAGYVEDPFAQGAPYNWDFEKIGYGSFAAGGDALASGDNSAAFGGLAVATGSSSFAAGFIAQAMGDHSAAFGEYSAATGRTSFVANTGTADGEASASFNSGESSGTYTFAANDATAEAEWSAAFGTDNIMRTQSGFAIGESADPILAAAETTAGPNSPLFIVGNGQYFGPRKNALTVLRSGRVGIVKLPGTATTDAALQVKSIASSHALQLEAASTTNKWSMHVSPSLQLFYNGALRGTFSSTTGGYTSVSDMRMKKNILPLGSVLSQLMNMKTYTYQLKDNEESDPVSFGFMAQEVEKIMPGLVTKLTNEDGQTLLGMNYSNFSVLAVRAIQEQQQAIEEMENGKWEMEKKIEKLEEENKEMRARLERLEKLANRRQQKKN